MIVNGKVALVTGAGSGIGRAASLALHAAGYSVVLAGRRAAELERTAASARPRARMLPVPTDIGQPDQVRALFARTKEAFGRLGRALQQRRHQRARHSHGRPHLRAVERRGGSQPHGSIPLRPAGHQADEGAAAARRAHHQQRLHLGPRARGPTRRRIPPPSTPSRG